MDALVSPVVVLTSDGGAPEVVRVAFADDGAVVDRVTGAPVDLASLVVLVEDEVVARALVAA